MAADDITIPQREAGEFQGVALLRALAAGGGAIALLDPDSGITLSYAQLYSTVQRVADYFGRRPRRLILLFTNNDIASVVCYLAALEAGHAVFISPVGIDHPGAAQLIESYRPEIVLWKSGALGASVVADYGPEEDVAGYRLARRLATRDPSPCESLGVVLSTSGSSGSSKAVRLPLTGVSESAAVVAEVLGMNSDVRVLANLPFGYVYGLSVLNSTLSCGGSLALVHGTTADRRFWERAAEVGVTMVPTVSQTLELMRRHGVDPDLIPKLRKLTHSGDSLNPGLFSWVHDCLSRRGVQVYLMYGQTEAGGRMTVLQPDELPQMHRSVGKPLRSCEVRIGERGEILFRGPGVMLGYAHRREDLAAAGETGGLLCTGDLGRLDERGFLHVTGRSSRDRKIFGKRINLDEVEAFARRGMQAAAVESGGIISIFFEGDAMPEGGPSMLQLARHFQLPPQLFHLQALPRLPCTVRGKIAYEVLTGMACGHQAPSPASE